MLDIVIFVRHSVGCKYAGDEFSRRCQCRKHFRWTQGGRQFRRQAGTRSWAEADRNKAKLLAQLSGESVKERPAKTIAEAVALFIADKKIQGLTEQLVKNYAMWLGRLQRYCEARGVLMVAGINREIIVGFCHDWKDIYPSSLTRSKLRERYRSFLRFCYQSEWLERVPAWPSIKVDVPPTLPLTRDEYAKLLDVLYVVNPKRWDGKQSTQGLKDKTLARVRASLQLMRWSGLAIRDALALEVSQLIPVPERKTYRVVTSRQKTGTHVSVLLPADVASELLAVAAGNPRYIFFEAEHMEFRSIARTWTSRYVRPAFEAAGIINSGHMVAHRLRDTFAVDLLEKGVPLEEVSKLLGHESIKTTERSYAAWVRGRQDRLDNLVAGTW